MIHSPRTLILLDVDGVLIHPVGYKVALRATVEHFGAQMGLDDLPGPDFDEIAVFEACGLTNEWDSSAMCISLLLLAALAQQPDLLRPAWHDTLAAIRDTALPLTRPDYLATARALAALPDAKVVPPSRVYLDLLSRDGLDADLLPLLSIFLQDVYTLDTPTTAVFQAFVLGHERFARTYRRPAPVQAESTLSREDKPLLSTTMRDRLLAWHQADPAPHSSGATIFTARPSLPPDPMDDAPPVYSPEAELGLELLGLDGQLPLMAQGRVGWLAAQHGQSASAFVKPAPVHALAAIGAAASGDERAGLDAAGHFLATGALSGPLAALADRPTRVIVFEDSTGGIRSTVGAVEKLRSAGLDIHAEAIGISPHAAKRAALTEIADHVVPDINTGLALVLDRSDA